jgi:hypothetical protein
VTQFEKKMGYLYSELSWKSSNVCASFKLNKENPELLKENRDEFLVVLE